VAQVGHQAQVLLAREQVVDGRELAGDADQRADGLRLGDDVVPAHAGDAGVRAHERREDVDRRRLSRPVRSQQCEHTGGRDVEVEIREHAVLAEGLREPFELDGRGHGVSERLTLMEP
jgi:hypothetical protein